MSGYNYESKSAVQPDPYGAVKMPAEMLIVTAPLPQPKTQTRTVRNVIETIAEQADDEFLVCRICGMTFKQQTRYDKHVRLHDGIDTSGIA